MQGLAQDFRHSFRWLSRSPGFTFTVVLTLALGMGATTLVYSVIQAVLLNSLPFSHADRLVVFAEDAKGQEFSVAWPNLVDWRAQAHSFTGMAGFDQEHLQYFDGSHTILVRAARVSASFFPILNGHPVHGRVFTDDEDRPGGTPVIVLAYNFWQNELHANPNAAGSRIDLSGTTYSIVGIMPADFRFFYGRPVDFYVPLGTQASDPQFNDRTAHGSIRVLARLAPGVTEAGALSEMQGIAARLAAQYPATNSGHSVQMKRLTDQYFQNIRPILLMLLAAVMLVLVVGCANVSNLLLARGANRAREYAIRTAMGAPGWRLVRQSLTETLLLAIGGGVCGLLLAYWGLPLMLHFAPSNIPRLGDTGINMPVLAFALALSVAVAILCSFLPALSSLRVGPEQALKISSALATRGRQGVRKSLLIAGVAVTVILTAGTGLLLESLRRALSTDPGFRPEHLLSLDIVLTSPKYENHAASSAFFQSAAEKVKAVPGVQAVGAAYCPPMGGDCWDYFYSIPGRINPDESNLPVSLFNAVDTNYFPTVGIRLLAGRNFSSTDTATSQHVVIVNRTFAAKWWPEGNAVGQTIRYGGRGERGDLREIVGVTEDVRQFGLDAAPEQEVFFPVAQLPREAMVLIARTAGDPAALSSAVEAAINSVDREVPVRIHPISASVAGSLRQRKFLSLLLSIFAGSTLFLAWLGIFGAAAYSVASRKNEIGLRAALGARPELLKRWISAQALRSVVLGCLIGIAGCIALLRTIRSLLYNVSPLDPLVLIASCALVIAISLLATWIPARRAAAIDPMEALRTE